QRGDPADGAGHAGPGGDHRLFGPVVHFRHQDAAGQLLPEEGGEDREGFADHRPRLRRQGDHGPVPRDREAEDGRFELARYRGGGAADPRDRALDGPAGGGGLIMSKRMKAAANGLDRNKFYTVEDAVKLVKERAKAKFDETIEMAFNLGIDPKQSDQNVRG